MPDLIFSSERLLTSRATISPCGAYRYCLSRVWDDANDLALWVMLNPSTADAMRDDPTVRRCAAFTRAWGFGGFYIVNLFALRSADPAALSAHPDPVGAENDEWIQGKARQTDRIILAWGAGYIRAVNPLHRARPQAVLALLSNRRLFCLGTTAGGDPRHPLYVRADTPLAPFQAQCKGETVA